MILKKLFIPSNCLQGEEIPVHLLWPKDKSVTIIIKIPKYFELLRIYNTSDFDINYDNQIQISTFEENGYLGMIFKTTQLPEHTLDMEIQFEIIDSKGEKQSETRFVHLFRPSIKVVDVPELINIKSDNKKKICIVKDNILISNDGEGIAVISFKASDNSQLKIEDPIGTGQFANKFWEDWSSSLKKLKAEFKYYTSIINKLISIGKSPPEFDEKGIEKMKEVFDGLNTILQTDSHFKDEFVKDLIVAFMKNLHIMTEIESFVTYLKSIDANRIIINNPIGVFKLGPKPMKFKGELTMVDLGLNSYPPIPLEIEFTADEKCEIPIHQVLKIVETEGVE